MKRVLQVIISLFLIFLLCAPNIFNIRISAFFYSKSAINGNIGTGRISLDINNLQISNGSIVWTEADNTINNGVQSVNSATFFSFDVNNYGMSASDYTVEIRLAWDIELIEFERLFIYPLEFSDESIINNLNSGSFEGAVIGAYNTDSEVIIDGTISQEGIGAIVDSGTLEGMNYLEASPTTPSQAYGYKLFFYGDGEVYADPALYHNKGIAINIIVRGSLSGRNSVWSSEVRKEFSIKSVIDTVFPVISEVSKPKTFFVLQANSIDLAGYATAYDELDKDITAKIVISSSPEFNPLKAGVYTITYNVKNSVGNEATPLVINITIWDFEKIASGNYHTLALTSHGKVYAFGYNAYGQLGDGTTAYSQVPKPVEGLDNIVDVAAGTNCSYALDSSGQAYAFGYNANGRLGDNTTVSKSKPVKVMQPAWVKFKKLAAGFGTIGGVTVDGDVYTWGYGGYGALGSGAGVDVHVPTKINVSNIESLSIGYYNGAAITKDGNLYTWGDNLHGQIGRGTTGGTTFAPLLVSYFSERSIRLKTISVGWYHMAAVSEESTLYTWGYAAEGRLGNGSEIDRNSPQLISLDYDIALALAGYYHTGIMTTDGFVLFCGQNAFGKHGTNNVTNHFVPTLSGDILGASDISLALDSSFVLVDNIAVYGMGYGGTGVLGTGNNENSTIPVKWSFVPPPPY